MEKIIAGIIQESLSVKKAFFRKNSNRVLQAAEQIAICLAGGHKVLIFGNGGSAADAQHMAAELVNRFKIERPPLAALALTTDSSVLTSIGNDYCFDDIFSKQIQALGQKHDVAIGISTSGNSPNVIKAMDAAKKADMLTMGFSGKGGNLAQAVSLAFCVDSDITARIQEVHTTLIHVLCELVERILFPEAF
ncbi:MAG: D-sedoheptulose 7-phosphate isomerase [Desulfobacterales bacterium]